MTGLTWKFKYLKLKNFPVDFIISILFAWFFLCFMKTWFVTKFNEYIIPINPSPVGCSQFYGEPFLLFWRPSRQWYFQWWDILIICCINHIPKFYYRICGKKKMCLKYYNKINYTNKLWIQQDLLKFYMYIISSSCYKSSI